jgi:hypothetical protein
MPIHARSPNPSHSKARASTVRSAVRPGDGASTRWADRRGNALAGGRIPERQLLILSWQLLILSHGDRTQDEGSGGAVSHRQHKVWVPRRPAARRVARSWPGWIRDRIGGDRGWIRGRGVRWHSYTATIRSAPHCRGDAGCNGTEGWAEERGDAATGIGRPYQKKVRLQWLWRAGAKLQLPATRESPSKTQ